MSVNIGSVMSKVRAYAGSANGKARMQSYIDQCIAEGRTTTASGEEIVDFEQMERGCQALIDCLRSEAAGAGLPESVLALFSTLDYTTPTKMADGSYQSMIYFNGNLSRESLYDDEYAGVDNIVALFNNGYQARNYVYGFWGGHRYTGDWNWGRSDHEFSYVRSRLSREGLHFINQAVSDFNGNFGGHYHAVAVAGGAYT